jgi:MATE family multidrug resistance protein
MLRLAVPVVLSDLGWMSIGSIFFYTLAMFGGGLTLGLDTLVSHAYGAGRRDECYRSLLGSLCLIVPLAPALMGIVWLGVPLFRVFRYEPALLAEIARFMRALVWSLPPLLVYSAPRRYLQASSRVGPVVFALVTAGSAWSTVAARIYMATILAAYMFSQDWPWHISLGPDFARARELLGLGFPAAGQITFEIGVIATAGALIGKLVEVPLAAHRIAKQTIWATYMVPLGISSAATVRVGQALGRGDPRAASRAG